MIALVVRRYVSLGNNEINDIADITQDVYLHLLSVAGEKYDPSYQVKVSTFVGVVARQYACNIKRGYAKRIRYTITDAKEGRDRPLRRGSREFDPAVNSELGELRRRMEQEPDDRMRTILRAIFVDDLTLQEAGDRVNLSHTWVKRLVDRWIAQEKVYQAVA